MLFPTTLVGSYPQPDWLIDRERLAKQPPARIRAKDLWRVPEPLLAQAQDDATVVAIQEQEDAGLDILTDGEIRRESYSNRFATALEGIDLDNPRMVTGRAGRPNAVPRIVGPLRRKHAVEVDDVRFLRAHTAKPIKMTVPGTVHDEPAGVQRALPERRSARHGLRRRRARGDPRPVRRRRGHRPDRRALHAGATREGARIWPQGPQSRARRHRRSDRRAYLLRLRRHRARASYRLFVSARARGLLVPPDLDRDRAIQARLRSAREARRQADHGRAASTSTT